MDAVSLEFLPAYLRFVLLLTCAAFQSLCFVFFCSDNDITDIIENTFSTEEERFGELISIPLIPGGENIEVTELNKKEYVESVQIFNMSSLPLDR